MRLMCLMRQSLTQRLRLTGHTADTAAIEFDPASKPSSISMSNASRRPMR